MGFKGSVESFSLADVFQNLAMNQQTGTLRVYSTSEEKNVFFQNGQVRHLSKGGRVSLVPPEVFIARGVITRQNLEAALSRQKDNGASIGSCMIDLGQITEEQLEEITRHQIEEEIYDLFSWDHASFEFTDGTPQSMTSTGALPATGPALPISHLIMEAARRVDEWERLRKLVPQYKEIYSMDLAVRKAIEKGEMEMDPVERRVAMMIDGARDVDDLIEDSTLFKFEVVNALAGFVQSSLIRPASVDELRFAEEDCARQNLPKRRIKVLERILALGGENTKVRRELAEILAREHETDRACIHFSVLADAETQAGKEDVAQDLYKRILSIAPKHVKSHEQLAASYARRGKKREAFGHYQELFETFREQNHMREARVAAACALECDPTHTDLRTALIELLLADNEKDAAAQQLELMGDQAARQNNVKVAADAYRRAMQARPGNKQLKKKLADAMLTKEDRRARTKKVFTVTALLIVVGLAGGTLTLIESSNKMKWSDAEATGSKLAAEAKELEGAEKYEEAAEKYSQAGAAYGACARMFSPILHYPDEARRKIGIMGDAARRATENAQNKSATNLKRARGDIEKADMDLRSGDIFVAKEGYEQVIKNTLVDDETIKAAKSGLDEAKARIAVFEEGKARLKRPPATEFPGVDQERSFKYKFWSDYKRFLSPDDVKLPLMIKPNTDGITVLVDGRNEGAIGQTSSKEQNTFRLAFGGHRLEFRKTGYKSMAINTADLQTPTYELKMERDPAVRIELQREDATIVLSGSATVDGSNIYVGTENGSLIQVGDQDNPITRRYDLSGPGGTLNKEVIGNIYVYKRAGKPDTIIYATRDGDVIAVEPNGAKFTEKWRRQIKTKANGPVQVSPQAPPSVLKLKIYGDKPIMVVPSEDKLYLVDCEAGTQVPAPIDLKSSVTSAVSGIEKSSTIVVGCSDGTVYGIDLGREAPREWSTGVRTAMVRGRPIFTEDRLLAGTSEGNLYFFDPNKTVDRRPDLAELAGSLDAELLVSGRYVYVGAALKEGFFCIDLPGRKIHWSKIYPEMGSISLAATQLGSAVYFCTENGKVFCIDAEKGYPRWTYQFPAGVKFSSSPAAVGNRIYCFTKNGVILGFDESQQGN